MSFASACWMRSGSGDPQDVVLPTRDGTEIRQRCIARPTEHQQILLDRLQLRLPFRLQPWGPTK